MKVKYPIKITVDVIEHAKKANLLCAQYLEIEKYICVNVNEDSYSIPHTASIIDELDYAERACNAHNKSLGYTKDEADKIIFASMNKVLEV